MRRAAILLALVLPLCAARPLAAAETDQHGVAHAWTGPSAGYTVLDFAAWIEARRQECVPYTARQPGMVRELAEGLLLWLAFQL